MSEEDYKQFVSNYEGYWKKKFDEILEDLTLNHPMIGFKYTRKELIEKWEDKKNE